MVCGLTYDKGISLAHEDLYGILNHGNNVLAVSLDDQKTVTID